MPRYHPNNDSDFYVERLIDKYHHQQPRPENHVLRRNPLKNPVRLFRDKDSSDPNRSFICSWGSGENFKATTGWDCRSFVKSRIRSKACIPEASGVRMWKISRTGPCGHGKLPLHRWNIDEWLQKSWFKKQRPDSVSMSSS